MKPTHYVKSAQITPFVRLLDDIGTPVSSISSNVGLPLELISEGIGVVGEHASWQFIDQASDKEAYTNLGFDCARRGHIQTAGEIGGLRMRLAPTLKVVIQNFIADAQRESTGAFYSLVSTQAGAWLCRQPMFGDAYKSWQVEQYMLENFIQIVRICAGPEWLPDEIRISSSKKPLLLPYEWTQTKIIWGTQSTQIKIPNKTLSLSPLKLEVQTLDLPGKANAYKETELNFSSLVRAQIYARKVGMSMAANQIGISPKTLQRKLLEEKTSYKEVVEQNRIFLAKELLETTDLSLSKISDRLGYLHHTNFTRSFKRLCGITPSAYKNLIK